MDRALSPRRPTFRQQQAARRQRAGLVLILVLIVVVMVALAGFSFAELMLTENKATHVHGDTLGLEQAMGSGAELLKTVCEQPPAMRTAAGGLIDNPTMFRAIRLLPDDRSGRQVSRQVCFSIVTPQWEEGQATRLRFGVENESGRLHLADLLRWEQQQPGSGRKSLMMLPGMTEAIADAILDWIDADSAPRPMGAENEYYSSLERPFAPRNALPECIEELLLVKGVTRQLLFGPDANYNHQIEPDELLGPSGRAPGNGRSTASTPWASLLTLHSGQRNLNSEGGPRVDLNSMDLTRLHQQLSVAVGPTWAGFIVALRQYGPYTGSDPGTQDTPPLNASTGPRFVFASVLDLVGVRVAVPSGTTNQPSKVYTSSLSNDLQGASPELSKLLDKTTTLNMPVICGGVSVNHASRDVLRAVPGMDDALADRIVGARDAQNSPNQPARRFPTWLLSEGLVDLTKMKMLMPNICAEGDVVRAEIIGHFEPPGQSTRAEVIIDATTLPARQMSWKDLRVFGPAYPPEWFGDESSTRDVDTRKAGRRQAAPASSAASRGTR